MGLFSAHESTASGPTERDREACSIFLTAVHGLALPEERLSFWRSSDSRSLHISRHGEIGVPALAFASTNLYLGVGLRRAGLSSGKRGERADVVALPGVWLDVDYGDVGHATTKLPSREEACGLLDEALPPASVVVDSGHGLHLYWLFDEPARGENVSLAEAVCYSVQGVVRTAFEARGWHLDDTADSTRILRVPGTLNVKPNCPPTRCTLVSSDGPRYRLQDLVDKYGAASRSRAATRPTVPDPGIGTVEPAPSVEELRALLQQKKPHLVKSLDGEPYAEVERDNVLFRDLCATLAAHYPHCDPEQLAEPFLASVDAASLLPGGAGPESDRAKFLANLARAQSGTRASRAAEVAELEDFDPDFAKIAAANRTDRGGAGEDPGELLARRARERGCRPSDLEHELIVQCQKSFWLYDVARDRYVGPLVREAVRPAMDRVLPWLDLTVRNASGQYEVDKNGAPKKATFEQVFARYGRWVLEVRSESNRSAPEIRDDVLHSAIPRQPLEAAYDADAARFLELLGGAEHEKLLDWLATILRLDRPSAMLCLCGASRAGKGMLARGLARLWRASRPTDMKDLAGDFNAALLESPFVYADEEIPTGITTARLRSLVGETQHEVRIKYAPNITLHGALRLMLGCNDDDLELSFKEELNVHDREALRRRFLVVHVDGSSVDFLAELGRAGRTRALVEGGGLARHVLWLAQTRTIVEGDSFAVEGNLSLDGKAATRTEVAVCQALAQLLADWPTLERPGIRVGGGEVRISSKTLQSMWETLMPGQRVPAIGDVGTALSNVGTGKRQWLPVGGGKRVSCYVVLLKPILRASQKDGIGDPDDIERLLQQPLGRDE